MPHLLDFVDSQFGIQLIGFIALGFSLIVFQLNKRSSMLQFQLLAALLYAVHFYLLGAFTGSAMNITGAARNYLFYKFKNHKRTWVLPGVFIVLFLVAGVVTWQGPLSLLPVFGMISGTLAFWQRNTTTIRFLSLLSPPLWFTYNYAVGSYPGMLIEIMIFTSILIGVYRFDIRKATA